MLSDLQYLVAIASGILAFLLQFGMLVYKISSAKGIIWAKIADVERDVLMAKLEATNVFVHKESFQSVMTNLDSRLVRLEDKLDRALELE